MEQEQYYSQRGTATALHGAKATYFKLREGGNVIKTYFTPHDQAKVTRPLTH